MTLRIATTQPDGSADVRDNGRIARALMRRAGAQGARLIQFPEGFLSGYAKAQIKDWADVDWSAVRAELGAMADLAAELGLWVVMGSAHPLTPPHRPHNSLYVISDQGRVVTRYDKRFCSNTEITLYYSPGCCCRRGPSMRSSTARPRRTPRSTTTGSACRYRPRAPA